MTPEETGTQAPDARVDYIAMMRDAGHTFDEIALVYGITRERVRQLAQRPVTHTQKIQIEKERTQQRNQRLREYFSLIAKSGLLSTIEDLTYFSRSAETDREVQELIRSDLKNYYPRGRTSRSQWSDAQIIKILREAATYAWPLSRREYQELIDVGEIKGPSAARIEQVYGWAEACELADVESPRRPGRHYQPTWTDNELNDYLADYVQSNGPTATYTGFDKWRLMHDPGAPSAQLIRNRLGSWAEIRATALLRVAQNDDKRVAGKTVLTLDEIISNNSRDSARLPFWADIFHILEHGSIRSELNYAIGCIIDTHPSMSQHGEAALVAAAIDQGYDQIIILEDHPTPDDVLDSLFTQLEWPPSKNVATGCYRQTLTGSNLVGKFRTLKDWRQTRNSLNELKDRLNCHALVIDKRHARIASANGTEDTSYEDALTTHSTTYLHLLKSSVHAVGLVNPEFNKGTFFSLLPALGRSPSLKLEDKDEGAVQVLPFYDLQTTNELPTSLARSALSAIAAYLLRIARHDDISSLKWPSFALITPGDIEVARRIRFLVKHVLTNWLTDLKELNDKSKVLSQLREHVLRLQKPPPDTTGPSAFPRLETLLEQLIRCLSNQPLHKDDDSGAHFYISASLEPTHISAPGNHLYFASNHIDENEIRVISAYLRLHEPITQRKAQIYVSHGNRNTLRTVASFEQSLRAEIFDVEQSTYPLPAQYAPSYSQPNHAITGSSIASDLSAYEEMQYQRMPSFKPEDLEVNERIVAKLGLKDARLQNHGVMRYPTRRLSVSDIRMALDGWRENPEDISWNISEVLELLESYPQERRFSAVYIGGPTGGRRLQWLSSIGFINFFTLSHNRLHFCGSHLWEALGSRQPRPAAPLILQVHHVRRADKPDLSTLALALNIRLSHFL